MVFLTALCTTIGAALVSDRIGRSFPEIAVGFLSVALLALVITLVSAPWEVQLALVIGAVVSFRSIG